MRIQLSTFAPLSRAVMATILVAGVSGCQGGEGTPTPDVNEPEVNEPETDLYTPEMLETYRAALPDRQVLRSPSIQSDASAVIGDPAAYPSMLGPQVNAVNQTVKGLIDTLEAVTELPPTFFDSDTLEFVWGPFDNDDTELEGDKVLVYIKDTGSQGDFRFHYAFVRSQGNDVATFAPVIWGATNPPDEAPDGQDQGSGILLYDFEANAEFELEHNDNPGDLPGGRFAVAFAKQSEGDDEATYVVSSFRDFSPEDSDETVSFDQFYGRYAKAATADDDGYTVDFADANITANVYPEEEDGSALENISIRVALIDEGYGRGQAFVDGGDLDDANSTVHGVECWNQFIARGYFRAHIEGDLAGDADELVIEEEGDFETGCPSILATDLEDLEIPTLDDLDEGLLAALDEIATNGIGDD